MIAHHATDWIRCTRQHPCPICGRPDWCGISSDGHVCRCMRVSDGSRRTYPDGGHLHILRESDRWHRPYTRTVRIAPPSVPVVDMGHLAQQCIDAMTPERLAWLGRSLGVSLESLTRYRTGWSVEHQAYTHPMHAADGSISGIRLRRPDGGKFSVRGGHEGVFYGSDWYPHVGESIYLRGRE